MNSGIGAYERAGGGWPSWIAAAQFNTAYRTQFGKDLPARAFIGVASLLRSGHFEMEGIAVKN